MNNKFTPKRIVEENITFSIPLYQRLFSWKEDNVNKLLYDLKEHFEKTKTPYYLGMLTCIKQQKEEKFLLIDGQQRMTVMLLMAIVFAKKHEEYDGWNNFLMGGNRIEFTARSEDKEYIQNKKEGTATNGYVNTNMEEALNTINLFLEKEFKDNMVDRDKFIENVYHHLTFFISELPKNYKNDTALLNKYFEAMNSQGRNLEQHEILKVELLKGIHDEGDILSNEDTLTNIWNLVSQMDRPLIVKDESTNMDDYRNQYAYAIKEFRGKLESKEDKRKEEWIKGLLGDYKEKVDSPYTIENIKANKMDFNSKYRDEGTDSIITFEELLLLVLDICETICNDDKSQEDKKDDNIDNNTNKLTTKSSISSFSFYQTDKLLERFQPLIGSATEDKANEIKKFYWTLLYYRLLLDYCVIRREFRNGEGNYTLLMKGDDNEEEKSDANQSDSYSKKLRQYQSMLYVSTPFYRWLKPFLMELAKGEINNNPEQMLEWLKKEDNRRHSKEMTSKEEMLSWKYPNIDRYWFWRLDYYLWETRDDWCKDEGEYARYYAKCKEAVSEYVFRSNRSIEHFHPQDESHNPTWEEKESIHLFGNLAMISQSFNSKQSNDHLQIKFDRVQEQIENKSLQSIKLLKMCIARNLNKNDWNPDVMKAHGEEMIDVLTKSFENNDKDSAE